MMKKLAAALATLTVLGFIAFSWLSNAEEPGAQEPTAETASTRQDGSAALETAAETTPNRMLVLEEGKNYRPVNPPQPTQSGDKIEVMEIFWYGCPHCHDFEPHLRKWLESKPDDVVFRRLPGVFRRNWVPAAQAFYAAELLGVSEKMHPALFHAIHVEARPLDDTKDWAKFFGELGVNEDEFHKAWDSLEVATKVRETTAQVQNYGIEGVPAIVVAGKYQTSAGMEGIVDYPTLLKVVDALVDKVREQAKSAD
jgi:thiol:disulfide interchange protein DsbA